MKNTVIAHNTFIDIDGPAISMDWGLGGRKRSLLPENVTIANNVILSGTETLFEGKEGRGFVWSHNIVYGAPLGIADRTGIEVVDPMLKRGENGLFRLTRNSPALDSAFKLEQIDMDMDGQPRTVLPDIGADEVSSEPALHQPLHSKDVGPDWHSY